MNAKVGGRKHPILIWSQRRGSNPRLAVYDTATLPTELLWPVVSEVFVKVGCYLAEAILQPRAK